MSSSKHNPGSTKYQIGLVTWEAKQAKGLDSRSPICKQASSKARRLGSMSLARSWPSPKKRVSSDRRNDFSEGQEGAF